MKKEFQPGDFARFPNEQIPRILDILMANGWSVGHGWPPHLSDGIVASEQCLYSFCYVGDPTENIRKQLTELTPHDFMTIALRLEEGMGIANGMTAEQRQDVYIEMERLGIKVEYGPKSIADFNCSFKFFMDSGWITSNSVRQSIPYEEWCRRLCVEPIGNSVTEDSSDGEKTIHNYQMDYAESARVIHLYLKEFCDENLTYPNMIAEASRRASAEIERLRTISKTETVEKTLEQHVDEYDENCSNNLSSSFDQTKPMQAFTPGAMWFDVKPENFAGFHKGYPVFWNESLHSYESYLDVRNVPEFNASMLEVGESMLTEEGDDGKRNLITKLRDGNYIDLFNLNGLPLGEDICGTIKGRKVPVEIKVTCV